MMIFLWLLSGFVGSILLWKQAHGTVVLAHVILSLITMPVGPLAVLFWLIGILLSNFGDKEIW